MSNTADIALASAPPPAAPTAEKASLTSWIAVLASMIGAFMAILNIQITNASLLDIEGGIGTGVDNGAWISTSYLIGEIIVIPLTELPEPGFFLPPLSFWSTPYCSRCFRWGCAFTHDLPSMIFMRGLQGFGRWRLDSHGLHHGADQAAKSAAADRLRSCSLVAVTFAPAIGPTIGGYLTENYGWQTIFFVNTPPSIVMVVALALTLERAPLQLRLLKEGDWIGIVTMAIGLASLQTVLEEGNKDDWFASPLILYLAIIAFIFLAAFIAIELTVKKTAGQSAPAQAAQFHHRRCRQHAAGFRAVRHGLYPAAISRPGSALQCRANRQCAGVDGVAATPADPFVPNADEAFRRALHRLRRHGHLRRQRLHERHAVL